MTAAASAAPVVTGPSSPRHAIDLGDLRQRLLAHPIYAAVDSPKRLRRFMEHHVFAVWDFQSLLVALQQKLTCTTIPWVPTPDREARRLINEIVLDEQSDELPDGSHASHFELYLEAMRQAGADTGPVETLLTLLAAGIPLDRALDEARVPAAAAAFVRRSFAIIASGSAHRIVAAFTYGREDVIPEMFRPLVAALAAHDPHHWERLRFYLERHIEADDEKHGPMCRRIVASLCGDDAGKWADASATARGSLQARIDFWDAMLPELDLGENVSR
jgi:pyrroloquinoline quinone (PQQ) biosynthesis protein C